MNVPTKGETMPVDQSAGFRWGLSGARLMASKVAATSGLVVALLYALSSTTPALAGDLAAPFSLETTAVLPKGVGNPRFIDVRTEIDNKYDGTGTTQALGQPLNKQVYWRDVLMTKNNPDEKNEIQAAMANTGQTANGTAGQTTGQVNTSANIFVPVFAFGLTEKLTLAVAVPVVNLDVQVDEGFVANSNGNKFVAYAAENKSPQAAEEAQGQMNNAVQEKLKWAGYEPLQNFTVNHVADTQLVAKYRAYEDGVHSAALKMTWILPTGVAPNPDKALDIPTGDGRFGLGAMAIHDMKLPWDLRWNNWAALTGWSPRTITKRIPYEIDDPISPDKEEIHENVRSLAQISTGFEKEFISTGIMVGGAYFGQYLSGRSYDAGVYTSQRYSWLEGLEPSQTLHSFVATAGISTVNMYNAKKFVYPFQAHLAYAKPFAGRNATTNELGTAELVLFF